MHKQPKVFIQSVKDPELRYEVVEYDKETKRATLRGRHGVFPLQPFTKAKIEADGYKLLKEGEDGPAHTSH